MVTQITHDRSGRPLRNPAAYQAAVAGNVGPSNFIPGASRQSPRFARTTKREKRDKALERSDAKLLVAHHTTAEIKRRDPAQGVLTKLQQEAIETFVKAQLAATTDLRRTWQRYQRTVQLNVPAGNSPFWVNMAALPRDSSDIQHFKPIRFVFVSALLSNSYGPVRGFGFLSCRWLVWNTELKASLGISDIGDLSNDYTVNRRDRTVPIMDYTTVYESEFRGLILRPDVEMEVWGKPASVQQAASDAIKVSIAMTGSLRKVEVGEL